MTIPLDKLYHYIESIAQDIRGDSVIIYRFYPHGSKKIENLAPISKLEHTKFFMSPHLYCNDQEPLNYELYNKPIHIKKHSKFKFLLEKYGSVVTIDPNRNLRWNHNIYDQSLLLHSEKRSENLEKYKNNTFIPVYYWSHAIIALDWFRYARHESFKKSIKKQFLIYNRAWGGTREYRLKFVDLLIEYDLYKNSQISFNPIEPESKIHYTQHTFINNNWRPNYNLDYYIVDRSVASSQSSADYEIDDYNSTEFEIVLETLFDDDRLHLTEKILRPIALEQPFLVAATCGSLAYLRSYGFKTFASVIDETYDTIEDPLARLRAMVNSMNEITQWSQSEREVKLNLIKQITKYNRKHFFSDKFINQVTDELKYNLKQAFDQLEIINTSGVYINRRKELAKYHEYKEIILNESTRQNIATVVHRARQYYMRSLSR